MTYPELRWVTTERTALRSLVDQLGAAIALRDGRVFVNGERVQSDESTLEPGALVEVFPPRSASGQTRILAIEDELIFAYKPASIPTEPDERGSAGCLLHELRALLGEKGQELHALSRLDTFVSGVVLVAASRAAAQRVTELRAKQRVRRRYIAVASGAPENNGGLWNESIGRGSRTTGRKVAGQDAVPAQTRFQVVAEVRPRAAERFSVLALEPITGRTHQLRVHASAHGAPLLGDRRYGGLTRFIHANGAVLAFGRIALHAAWVELPMGGGLMKVAAEPAPELCEWWCKLGGSEAEFLSALADDAVPGPATGELQNPA